MLSMRDYLIKTGNAYSAVLGYEGENNARTLRIKTTDDISDFASVNLLIDTLDCGQMTVETVSNYKVLSMVLTAAMLGEAGKKTCQLLMMDSEGTVIKKSNQFQMVVGASNDIEETVPESPVIIAISDYVEEKVDELLDNFTVTTDTTLTQSGMAADAKTVGDVIDDSGIVINNIVLPFVDDGRTALGITFTTQGNRVHAIGTATGNVNFYLKQDVTFDDSVKSIIVSGCPLGGSSDKYAIRVGKYNSGGSGSSGWSSVLNDYGLGGILNITPNSKYVFVCTVFSGATVDIYFDPKVFCNIDKSIPTIRKTLYDYDEFVFIKPVKENSNRHGECIILNGEKKGIFDLGYDENCETLIAELQSLYISSIDYVVISHYHSDHITTDFATAIDTLITAGIDFSDCVFFLPHYGIDWASFSGQTDNKESVEAAVINKLDALGFRHVHPENNQIFILNDNLSFRFLNIGNYENYYSYTLGMSQQDLGYTNYNSFSMVTDVDSHGNHILISADATNITLDTISDYLYNCDLYKIEHHGLNKKTSYKWLNKLNPKYCVITSYSDDYSDDFTLSRDTPRSLAVNSVIFSTLDGKVVAKSQRGYLSCSGSTINNNYRRSAILSISDTVINAVLKSYDEDSTSIVSTSTYITTTGKYYVLNGICYFSVLIFFEKSVNTGINNVFGLPKPDSNNINNEYSPLDELGNSTPITLYYNPTNNNWRLNGPQSAGHYLLAYGAYKVESI